MLEKINSPKDLKDLKIKEKNELAKDIRDYILEVVSQNGGHLASNLGVVELTIALHSVFNTPEDKIIWDVGHQSYVHKILTGRKHKMGNIRKFGGIAGFPKTKESQYDTFNTGHSSTSISAALGMARARDLKGKDNQVVAVIGDGSLTGGMAMEALNDAGFSKTNITVILNDNQMSISKNNGGLNNLLGHLRSKKLYTRTNNLVKRGLSKIPGIGPKMVTNIQRFKMSLKQLLLKGNGMYFEDIGFTYLGPVDGHNISKLESIMRLSKKIEGPVLIHVLTKKGKGYKIAEENPDKFHAIGPFNIETGEPKSKKGADYSKVFGDKLVKLAKKNDKIVAITASMKDGTGLKEFAKQFPTRFYDIGIAEQHALTMAAGMATEGMIPVVPIYSSFYQRGYDQVIHDIALQNLPVVMCVDRAGLVGADGETHQGMLDMAFFRLVPNLVIMAPKNFKELESMLEFAVNAKRPVVIRYPRGGEENLPELKEKNLKLEIGKAETLKNGTDITIIAIGKMVARALEIAKELEAKKKSVEVINARFLKPLDKTTISKSIKKTKFAVTIEDGTKINGLGTAVKELIVDDKIRGIKFKSYAYPDEFIPHGSVNELEDLYNMSTKKIASDILKECEVYKKNK
ncbi:MAG: 1-deoxy-D-xylulose-5-phosphate synthase [Clostridia bacterium]|nr:1-deoxy-D-xylulose-5-phosphate synthase [Clostridia bacterium]